MNTPLLSSEEQIILRRCSQVSPYYKYGRDEFLIDHLSRTNSKLAEELANGLVLTSSIWYEVYEGETEERVRVIDHSLQYPHGFMYALQCNEARWCSLVSALLYTLVTECIEYREGILSNLYECYIAEITPTNKPDKDLENWFKTGILNLIEFIKQDIKELKESLTTNEKINILDVEYTSEVFIKLVYIID